MEYQADSNSTSISYLLSGTCGVKVVIFLDNFSFNFNFSFVFLTCGVKVVIFLDNFSFCFSNKTE